MSPPGGATPPAPVGYAWRGVLEDDEVDVLHAASFGHLLDRRPWRRHLAAHSVGWVTARRDNRLLGFVNVVWDGQEHAFLVDVMVTPEEQRDGVGAELVRRAIDGARSAGCRWVHVDFEPALTGFYIGRCGLTPTPAGLRALRAG